MTLVMMGWGKESIQFGMQLYSTRTPPYLEQILVGVVVDPIIQRDVDGVISESRVSERNR